MNLSIWKGEATLPHGYPLTRMDIRVNILVWSWDRGIVRQLQILQLFNEER